MNKDQIIKMIPLLSKQDLKAIKALIDQRLAGEKVLVDENVRLVIKLLSDVMGTQMIASLALHPPWAKNAADLVTFVDETFPDVKQVARVWLIKLCLGLVIDDLKVRMSVVTPGVVLVNLVRVREVFDAAFPGYRQDGLQGLILKSMKGNR